MGATQTSSSKVVKTTNSNDKKKFIDQAVDVEEEQLEKDDDVEQSRPRHEIEAAN